MTEEQIQRIGRVAFSQSGLRPLNGQRRATKTVVVGFDSEYDSHTRELISIQFSHAGNGRLFEVPKRVLLTRQLLESYLYEFLQRDCLVPITKRHTRAIKLICYFSLAETQHIVDIRDATCFETSVGVDFVWESAQGDRTIEIVDLAKFYNPPPPLAEVARDFGLRKLEWDRANVTRADLSQPAFVEYAIHDATICEVAYNSLRDGYLKYGADIIHTKTAASTALTIFRLNYLDRECDQPSIRLRRLGLRANWGGRNEAFCRGVFTGRIYEYDAVSEYPNSAIQLRTMPHAESWRHTTKLSDLLNHHGIARIEFCFPADTTYPCLPVYHKVPGGNGKLYYPLSGVSDCTNAEIQLAVRLGATIRLIEGYHYRERDGTDALRRFMEYMQEKRNAAKASGDKSMSLVYKLNMNSVIGKFIQRVDKKDLNVLTEISRREGTPIPFLQTLDEQSLQALADAHGLGEAQKISLGAGFYPEWNTLILGFARAATSEAIIGFAQLGYRVLLSSTDSVIFYASDDLPEPPEEFVSKGIRFVCQKKAQRIEVIRTRLYRMTDADGQLVKIAHHAIPRRHNAMRAFDAWSSDTTLSEFTFENKRLRKYRESLTRGTTYGEEVVEANRRARFGFDDKRILLADGSTKPWDRLETTAQRITSQQRRTA